MSKVEKNSKVKVHYTGTLKTGEQFDSSQGREPLEFVAGAGQMIAGFDAAVIGMALHEKKTITLAPDEAYGPVHEQLINKVEKNKLPAEIKPEVGQSLTASAPDGRQTQVLITAVDDETITIDANHPLAGKDLVFDIEVVEIEA